MIYIILLKFCFLIPIAFYCGYTIFLYKTNVVFAFGSKVWFNDQNADRLAIIATTPYF